MFQLNVFHWHIVDTQSFPVELSDEPTLLMSQYGAYGPKQIYSREDIVDIVNYANLKGDLVLIYIASLSQLSNVFQV